jgi:CHAT domain
VKELRIMVQPSALSSKAAFQVLHERDGMWIGPPPLGAHTAIAANFREETEQKLKDFMLGLKRRKPGGFEFKNFCRSRYDGVVPKAVQELLEAADKEAGAERPRLNVYSHEAFDWIPWEALFSEKMQEYLGVRFEVCRLPIVDTPPVVDSQPRTVKSIRHLLGLDVFDAADPAHAPLYLQWQQTFDPLVPSLRRPDGDPLDKAKDWPTLDELEDMQQTDILHITCHGVKEIEDNEARVAWALGSPKVAGSERVHERNLPPTFASQGRPLIFGNACGSAQSSDLLPGLGTVLFRKGALNVIGTFAPVRIDVAIPFAKSFYGRLLGGNGQGGIAIGKALLETRIEFHNKLDADVSHLFYCLFGPGGTQFKV